MDEAQVTEALADISDAMQEIWSRHGWVQGRLGSDGVGYCMMGCWYKATGVERQEDELTGAFRRSVRRSTELLFPLASKSASVESTNDSFLKSEEDARLLAKHAVLGIADEIDCTQT